MKEPDFKKFANEILDIFFDGGTIDGFDIQEIAEDCGIIKKIIMTESCGENCTCAEVADFPCECYIKTYNR